jgi:ABC-2 type transport system ATP-binding protein
LLAEMAQTIDDAVIVSFGQLKARGTLDEITSNLTGIVMRARTPEADRLSNVLTGAGIAFRRITHDEVAMDAVTPEQVGPLLAQNQIVLYELIQEGIDLESVFLSLTAGLGFGDVGAQSAQPAQPSPPAQITDAGPPPAAAPPPPPAAPPPSP